MRQRYFNTSGPNILNEHYTLMRQGLVKQGLELVSRSRYFTIWSPRQSGKSTYFRLLAKKLECEGFRVTHINVENFRDATKQFFLQYLCKELKKGCEIDLTVHSFAELFGSINDLRDTKCVLIIDEIEGLQEEIFCDFLHTIRNLYHSRDTHCLKSVILVGVSNITGIIEDNASPFNITETLEVPYFTLDEVYELFAQHESEKGQKVEKKVKEKIFRITAGQPGLVNGFGYKLAERCEGKGIIAYDDYLKVENWYINKAIDKNVSNIINKAKKYRDFIERMLFSDENIVFKIDKEEIKFLHVNGVIHENDQGNVEFWVPLYKKKLYNAFYPHKNGEGSLFFRRIDFDDLFTEEGHIDFDSFINNFRDYVKRRSFRYFRERDEKTGRYKQIKEAALVYAFEAYIQYFLNTIGGKSYLEAHAGLGRSDLIVNYMGYEYVIEVKIYRNSFQYKKGKKQLVYYCGSMGIQSGIYLVFVPVEVERVQEGEEEIDGVSIKTYVVEYDEEKDF